jgi:hypothetical protein
VGGLLLFGAFFVILAVAGPFYGIDSRDSRDWKSEEGRTIGGP